MQGFICAIILMAAHFKLLLIDVIKLVSVIEHLISLKVHLVPVMYKHFLQRNSIFYDL